MANYGCQDGGYEKEERFNLSVATADGSDMVDPPNFERDENGDDLKYKYNSTTSTRWIYMTIFTLYVVPGMESGPLLLVDQHNTSGRRKQNSHATTLLFNATMSPLIVLSCCICIVLEKDTDNYRVLLVQCHVKRSLPVVGLGCGICPVVEK